MSDQFLTKEAKTSQVEEGLAASEYRVHWMEVCLVDVHDDLSGDEKKKAWIQKQMPWSPCLTCEQLH